MKAVGYVLITAALLVLSASMAMASWTDDFESYAPGPLAGPWVGNDAPDPSQLPDVQAGGGWDSSKGVGFPVRWGAYRALDPSTKEVRVKFFSFGLGVNEHDDAYYRIGICTTTKGWPAETFPEQGAELNGRPSVYIDSVFWNLNVVAKDFPDITVWQGSANVMYSGYWYEAKFLISGEPGAYGVTVMLRICYSPTSYSAWWLAGSGSAPAGWAPNYIGIGVAQPNGICIDEITTISTGKISGTINLGGYTGDGTDVPVTVQIRVLNAGTNDLAVPVKYVRVTPGNGAYEVPDVAAGTYDVAFKAPSWLAKKVTGISPGGAPVDVTLLNGDVNGDNGVTSSDLGALMLNLDRKGDH